MFNVNVNMYDNVNFLLIMYIDINLLFYVCCIMYYILCM